VLIAPWTCYRKLPIWDFLKRIHRGSSRFQDCHCFFPAAAAAICASYPPRIQMNRNGPRTEAFVIYPFLPNHFIDPWRLINPREVWAVIIILAGIGFANYVLLRLYGTRGLYYTTLLYGLARWIGEQHCDRCRCWPK
jgi:hypothetical protein